MNSGSKRPLSSSWWRDESWRLVGLFKHLGPSSNILRVRQDTLVPPKSVSDIITGGSKEKTGRMSIPGDCSHFSILGSKPGHWTSRTACVPQVHPLVPTTTSQIPIHGCFHLLIIRKLIQPATRRDAVIDEKILDLCPGEDGCGLLEEVDHVILVDAGVHAGDIKVGGGG